MKQQVLFQMKQLQNLIVRNICMVMNQDKHVSLSLIQSEMIGYIIQSKQTIYQKDLEKIFKLRRSTISGILKTLERKNLIQKIGSEDDARVKKIILTTQAIEFYQRANQHLEQLEQKMLMGIPPEELQIFYQVVKKMQQNIETE